MKFLRGVLQPPFKERKHPERMRKKWAGENDTDSDGDGTNNSLSRVRPERKKLSLEEQIKERNLNANQFNFYAMDKPN